MKMSNVVFLIMWILYYNVTEERYFLRYKLKTHFVKVRKTEKGKFTRLLAINNHKWFIFPYYAFVGQRLFLLFLLFFFLLLFFLSIFLFSVLVMSALNVIKFEDVWTRRHLMHDLFLFLVVVMIISKTLFWQDSSHTQIIVHLRNKK